LSGKLEEENGRISSQGYSSLEKREEAEAVIG
jgi:hypothetical protein